MSDSREIDRRDASDDAHPAERGYREAITSDPGNVRHWLTLAASLEARDRLEEAVGVLRQASTTIEDSADLFYEFARALTDLEERNVRLGNVYEPYRFKFPWGDIPYPVRQAFPPRLRPEATEALNRCLHLDAGHGPAKSLLGFMAMTDGAAVSEAGRHIQEGLQLAPENPFAHFAMGWLALFVGGYPVSVAAFRGAAERGCRPQQSSTLAGLAEILAGQRDHAAFSASGDADTVATLADGLLWTRRNPSAEEPNDAVASFAGEIAGRVIGLAIDRIHLERGFVDGARLLSLGMALDPNHVDAPVAVAALMFAEVQIDIAEAAVHNATLMGSAHPLIPELDGLIRAAGGEIGEGEELADSLSADAMLKLGLVHAEKLELDKAGEIFRRVIDLDPDCIEARIQLSVVLSMQDDRAGALEAARGACDLRPNDAGAQLQLSLCLLSKGRLDEAWPRYEERFRLARRDTPRQPPPVPRWNGEAESSKRLLVWREEGIGDEVRFSTCIPDIAAAWPGQVVFECSARMVSVFRRSFPEIEVRAEDLERSDFSDMDFQIPVASLPMHFRTSIDEYPRRDSFLIADPARVEHWCGRMSNLGSGPMIGVGWHSLNMAWQKKPLMTELRDWGEILSIEGLNFVNLQCDLLEGELDAAEREFGVKIHSFDDVDLKNDLEETLAIMAALDTVVSARCWVLQFASAVGTKCYGLSAHPNPYMFELDYDPWTPIAEIFYRDYGEGWDRPMAEVAARLREQFDR